MKNEILEEYSYIIDDIKEMMENFEDELNGKRDRIDEMVNYSNRIDAKNRTLIKENETLNKELQFLRERIECLTKENLELKKINQVKKGLSKEESVIKRLIKGIEAEEIKNNQLVSYVSKFLEVSNDEMKYKFIARYLPKADILEISEKSFLKVLELLKDERVIEEIDEKYLMNLIDILMRFDAKYDIHIRELTSKILNNRALKKSESKELMIYLGTYFVLINEFILDYYKLFNAHVNRCVGGEEFLKFLENRRYINTLFNILKFEDSKLDYKTLEKFNGYLEKRYFNSSKSTIIKQMESNIGKIESEKDIERKDIAKVIVKLDKVDSLSISNNIKTCHKDKSALVRKRVELAVHNKHNSFEKTMVEISVYHCKECRDYIVNTELIRSIYKSIDIKKNYINFKSTDNLNQISVINALGYNTNINLRERLETIDNIIIPTVGARKLLHHLEFLVRFQKNNTKDFSHAISVWKHDIAYLKRHYSV
ncbi:MAG: hypothetical protein ACRCWM_06865 [Sarcina sp.]